MANQQNSSVGAVSHPSTPVSTVVRQEGAGKAYQSVAQSTAIAIQDATDNLRNVNTMSTTAQGVAMAQFLATGETKYAKAMELAQSMATAASTNFLTISTNASDALKGYPSGQ